jgi:hypothetical protein
VPENLSENELRAVRCISEALTSGLAERGINAHAFQVLGRQTPGGGLDIVIRNAQGVLCGTQIGPILAWTPQLKLCSRHSGESCQHA